MVLPPSLRHLNSGNLVLRIHRRSVVVNERRQFLVRGGQPAAAIAPLRASISVPGPGNLLHLPIPPAGKIGADPAEGLQLDIRYTGGGPQAIRSMLERNSDFAAAAGLPALALQKLSGKPVDRFLRATEPDAVAKDLSVRSLVDARWAGSMP